MTARRFHHCRGCGKPTPQSFAGYERRGTSLETVYWRCDGCQRVLIQYADVEDAEGLALYVANRSGFITTLSDDDRQDLLDSLNEALWAAYLSWRRELSVRFRPYAATKLRNAAIEWRRKRRGRGNVIKPLAVADSLDAPAHFQRGGAGDTDERGDRLDEALGGVAMDDSAHSLLDLRRTFYVRRRELADVEARIRRNGSMGRRTDARPETRTEEAA